MSTIDASGLLKTSSTDANAGDTVAAPVFTSVESDDTVVNSDGSRFETVTTYSQNHALQSQVITTPAASGKWQSFCAFNRESIAARCEV